MKIYLIRHGQTTGDIEDRYGGDYDDHLTDLGIKQGKELANKLASLGIEKIFCSPRIRAREIADIVDKKLNCGIEIIDDLRERNQYGILTGMVRSKAKKKYPESAKMVENFRSTIEGAEDYDSFKNRIRDALSEILRLHYSTITIITHGGPIKVIFREIIKIGEIKINDCGFVSLESDNGELRATHFDGIIKLNPGRDRPVEEQSY